MISFTQLQTMYGDLSLNSTAGNLTRGAQLMNIEQKYLLQKYFSNESSYTITTVGSTILTLTASPAIAATTATLTSVWTYPTLKTAVTFSDGEQREVTLTNNSTALSWANGLNGTLFYVTANIAAGATTATLQSAWAYATQSTLTKFSDGETKTVTFTQGSTAISWSGGLSSPVTTSIYTSIITVSIGVGGVQTYKLPPDYSKLKTGTLTIGSLRWTPTEILTREEWDNLNVFPYYADIPSHFFVYNNQFKLWPIPSTTGNIIQFNYKRRVPDLSMVDTSAGTVSVGVGGTTVTGVSTSWIPTVSTNNESRWIVFPQPTGDNLWYQVQSVDNATSLTLYDPYYGTTAISGGTYTMGQMPVLIEDFQDMLLWKALVYYFTSIVDNKGKREEYQANYDRKLELLAEYAGSKTIHVNLGRRPNKANPNLFPQTVG